MNDAAVAAERERAEQAAEGPLSSSLLVAGGRFGVVFLAVKDARPWRRVFRGMPDDGELDSESQWIIFKQSKVPTAEYTSLQLRLAWPTVGEQMTLFFALSEWRNELEIIAETGIVFLYVNESKIPDESVGVELETETLRTVLAVAR